MAFSIKDFTARINWRQIVIHALAFLFFMYAFEALSTLAYVDIVKSIRETRGDIKELANQEPLWPIKITSYKIVIGFASFGGLIVALIIGLFISHKKRWFWFNTFLSFLLVFLLIGTHLTGWHFLNVIFYFPGRLFSNLSIEFFLNGAFLLSIGFFLLFAKTITRFISGSQK